MQAVSNLFRAGLQAGLLFTCCLPAAAQAPAWQSAQAVAVATTAVTGNVSIVTATTVDAAGNVYVGRRFYEYSGAGQHHAPAGMWPGA